MNTIFWRTIKDRWRMLLAITLIGLGTMLMYISMFPMYQDMMAENEQMFEQIPEAMKQAFNMDELSFNTLEKFLNIEMYSLFWLVLTIILALSMAGSSIAGDVERETIVQTASQPVARFQVYASKFLAAAAIFTVFNFLVNASAIPLAVAFNVDFIASHYFVVGVMCELFGLALLGVGFAVSAFLSDKGKVYMAVGGALLVMYVLNIVAAINDKVEVLKYFSLFHYFNPSTFLVKGEYDLTATLVFAGLLTVGFMVGWWRFSRRDIS